LTPPYYFYPRRESGCFFVGLQAITIAVLGFCSPRIHVFFDGFFCRATLPFLVSSFLFPPSLVGAELAWYGCSVWPPPRRRPFCAVTFFPFPWYFISPLHSCFVESPSSPPPPLFFFFPGVRHPLSLTKFLFFFFLKLLYQLHGLSIEVVFSFPRIPMWQIFFS